MQERKIEKNPPLGHVDLDQEKPTTQKESGVFELLGDNSTLRLGETTNEVSTEISQSQNWHFADKNKFHCSGDASFVCGMLLSVQEKVDNMK